VCALPCALSQRWLGHCCRDDPPTARCTRRVLTSTTGRFRSCWGRSERRCPLSRGSASGHYWSSFRCLGCHPRALQGCKRSRRKSHGYDRQHTGHVCHGFSWLVRAGACSSARPSAGKVAQQLPVDGDSNDGTRRSPTRVVHDHRAWHRTNLLETGLCFTGCGDHVSCPLAGEIVATTKSAG